MNKERKDPNSVERPRIVDADREAEFRLSLDVAQSKLNLAIRIEHTR